MQMLASYFEGPVHISNISIVGNSFEVDPSNNVTNATIADILETEPSCSVAEGIVQSENVVVRVGADPSLICHEFSRAMCGTYSRTNKHYQSS